MLYLTTFHFTVLPSHSVPRKVYVINSSIILYYYIIYLLNLFSYTLLFQLVRSDRLQLKCDGTRWSREGKWRGNWRMEWVASTLHATSEHGVSSITTADAHTSAASSRLNWRPRRFKWTRPFRRKTKSGFCACAITFQKQYTLKRRIWASLCLSVCTHVTIWESLNGCS